MRLRSTLALISALALAACSSGMPDLDQRITQTSRDAPYPTLVPLGPLLAQVDALLPRRAAAEGQSLEARAADLRRRAAQLRRMSIS
ncbi:hypothetical protein roselon_03649 [Roseibacterium elongatum DSM 19469]|uniref:Lipoprotein n=1 Tax=Roseicyclus elongatus DSM 19469 TaxID=1294273 RepID=W8SA50_9RHOB|nr:hypothetical protein [Roseibacterium elongatum]AHM05891.1 hypothetical protein roselon_03649 [Roseibacterium elongatum DSM 19469]